VLIKLGKARFMKVDVSEVRMRQVITSEKGAFRSRHWGGKGYCWRSILGGEGTIYFTGPPGFIASIAAEENAKPVIGPRGD